MRVRFDDGTAKYACNNCKRNFSEEHAEHITLVLDARSGWVREERGEGRLPGWRFWRMIVPQRVHFCPPSASSCMLTFFAALEQSSNPEFTR